MYDSTSVVSFTAGEFSAELLKRETGEDAIAKIDAEIERLEKQMIEVEGTECEVYTRIVGYHRAIENWNKGKAEEYKDRVTFKYNKHITNTRLDYAMKSKEETIAV